MVNTNACKKATSSSNIFMNSANGTAANPAHADLKININEIRLNTTICPAVMFAKRRIIKANGFVNVPASSIGINAIRIGIGTPGIQKI